MFTSIPAVRSQAKRGKSRSGSMSRELAITIAVVSSLMAVASSAVAGQTISDRNYWPSEVAVHRWQPKAATAGPLSSFAFDRSGPQPGDLARSREANGSYRGGPHPR
jgi:hypothetical protein